MTVRKGEMTGRWIDRDCPYQVAIRIPPGGLGMCSYGDFAKDARWLATARASTGAAAFPQLFRM